MKEIECDFCGEKIKRYPSQIKKHNFCSKKCLYNFNSKDKNPEGYKYRDFSKNSARFTKMNKDLNPIRMNEKTKKKIREKHLNTGKGKSYKKYHGKHFHRIVAEKILGRPLKKNEVVHHIDGNKRNNSPSNLKIFKNQAEHAKYHFKHDKNWGIKKEEV